MGQQKTSGVCLLSAGVLFCCGTASAQPGTTRSPSASAQPGPAEDILGRSTPRGTVLGFLLAERKGNHEVAVQYLNTRLRGEAAATLAHQLYVVLDRRLPGRLSQLSDRPGGSLRFPATPDQDLVGTIGGDGGVDIIVERVDRKGNGSLWLFSSKTLAAVPDLYEEANAIAVENVLPGFLVKTRIGHVPLFELLAVFIGLPLLYLIPTLVNRLLSPIAGRVRRHVAKNADLPNPQILPKPVRLLIMGLTIRWTLSKVGLPLLAREFWSSTAAVITIAASIWILILLNGVVENVIRRRLVRAEQSGATSVLRLGRRALDLLWLVAGILVCLHYFGVNLTAALAGLGVGGIAVALAAQKTLENVIGGISVIFDQTVRVGDRVKVCDKDGFVEDIGLRSTRIRTDDRTVVSVPNGQLAMVILENLSLRDKFWFHHTLRVRYEMSASTMRDILDSVNIYLAQDTRVERGSVRVRFISFGSSSFDVEIFAYIFASDWAQFLETQQELLLGIVDNVERAGASMALPSQTLYLATSKAPGTAEGAPVERKGVLAQNESIAGDGVAKP
jgi:MscS family membrane protein